MSAFSCVSQIKSMACKQLILNQGFKYDEFQCDAGEGWKLKLFRLNGSKLDSFRSFANVRNDKVVILWHGLSTSSDIFIASSRYFMWVNISKTRLFGILVGRSRMGCTKLDLND